LKNTITLVSTNKVQENVLYVLFSFFIAILLTQYHQDIANPIYSIQEYLDGKVDRIVARRALSIWLLNYAVQAGINGKTYFMCLELGSIFSVLLLLKSVLSKIGLNGKHTFLALPLFTIAFSFMAIFPNKLNIWYSFDFISMLAFLLAFISVLTKKWPFLFVLIPIAALNRETSILIVVLFAISNFNSMPKWKLALFSVVMILEWWAVKQWLISMYPSELASFQNQYVSSFQFLIEMVQKKSIFRLSFLLGVYGFLWVPIAINWRRIWANRILLSASVVVITHYILMFTFSNVYEYRWGIEMLGYVVLLCAISIKDLWQNQLPDIKKTNSPTFA